MPISNDLVMAVSDYIKAAFKDAQFKAKTKRIRDNLQMTDAQLFGQSIVASIEVSLLRAPEARAYEFGSGTHDLIGSHLIPIRAVHAKALSFWWEMKGKQFVGKELGRGHPGVAAHPALGPAMEENKNLLVQNVDMYVRQAIESVIIENNARIRHGFS